MNWMLLLELKKDMSLCSKLGILWVFLAFLAGDEKSFVVVIPSYNNIRYYKENLRSILRQDYQNYRVIYINDCSTDGTGKAVEQYLRDREIDFVPQSMEELASDEKHFFVVVQNAHRCGAMENIYRTVQSIADHDIVILLDGDDVLYDFEVLKRVNDAYHSEKEVWMTHGTLIADPYGHATWSEPVLKEIIENNDFRTYKCPSPLRTFYAWLFKKVDLDDFLYEGHFLRATYDMAIMYPIIEMAGDRHVFLKQVNYIYNMNNSLNDNKANQELQNQMDKWIRSRPRYQRLQEFEIPEFMVR